MSKVQMLRALVEQRLTLAAEEIFELFERTMVEYEEELCRQGKLLNAIFQPEVRLHRADVGSECVEVMSSWKLCVSLCLLENFFLMSVFVFNTKTQQHRFSQPTVAKHYKYFQQLMVNREAAPPEQQIWSPSLDQQNPPELPNIKVEQEELWTTQEEEQLQLLEEADITKFTFTPVKSEDEEEKLQTSQLHQDQTEELRDAEHLKSDADEEHSGRSEGARNLNPNNHLETPANDKTSHFSEPETDDSYDWEEMKDSESGLKPLQNNEVLLSDKEINTGKTSVSSSECAAKFGHKGRLQKQKHNEAQIGVSSFSCSDCGKGFHSKTTLRRHMRLHSATNRFSCSVCSKTFLWRRNIKTHMRIHTGEKPFSCSVCGKKFAQSSSLTLHLRVHTGEKPFQCSICKARFSMSSNLYKHVRMHSGEKPFSCSICGKIFVENDQLRRHVTTHTGEKPFSCSVCGKRFAQHGNLRRHSNVHTGNKPFRCSICDKRFSRLHTLKKHKCVGDNSRNK